MNRRQFLVAALLIAGCNQQPIPNADAGNSAEAAEPQATAEVPQLDGEWQVTEVDGRALGGSAMAAVFAGGRLQVTAGCNRRAWSYTQKRNILSFVADPSGSGNCENPPTQVQDAAFHALDLATIAIFDRAGREASLSGSGGNLTIVRR